MLAVGGMHSFRFSVFNLTCVRPGKRLEGLCGESWPGGCLQTKTVPPLLSDVEFFSQNLVLSCPPGLGFPERLETGQSQATTDQRVRQVR